MSFDPARTVLIMGTGAMACLFAARLSAAGVPVLMYGTWPEGLQALRTLGVRLVKENAEELAYPVQVVAQPKDCLNARYALVLVKSWQTRRAAMQLAECLAVDGVALTLQNGMGNRELLSQILGAKRVILGVTTIGATLLGPGRVRQAGEGVISLSSHPGLSPLVNQLGSAGFVIENEPDPTALLWGKLVINAAINPITALLGVTNGELLARSTARALLQAIVREAASVAVAQGIRLPYPDPVIAAETIARRTGTNRSSMLQDVLRGAPTEIDAICGAIVRASEKTGVPAPTIRTMWQLINALRPEEK
jgi:2-dehydropantoate 2-reductase